MNNLNQEFKKKFISIINDIEAKKIKFAHKDKLYLYSYILSNFSKAESRKLALKALLSTYDNNPKNFDEFFEKYYQDRDNLKKVFKKNSIPKLIFTLKSYDIDINSHGIAWDYRTVEKETRDFTSNATNKNVEIKEGIKYSKDIFTETEEALSRKYDLRYNTVSYDIEYKEKKDPDFKTVNENTLYIELRKSRINISINNLVALMKSDFIPHFDPFSDYFENLPPWDKKFDCIDNLAEYVKAKENKEFKYHFKKWLVRVVANALNPEYFNKQALILVQNTQNTGKSTFCRFLCPKKLKDYIAEDISTDKDSRIALAKNFLINLDELSTLSKRDTNALKNIFSKEKINERLPYDRKNSIIPRRCSFVGSTNQIEFLNDETGTVRWLCFEIEGINWKYTKEVDIDLVYSQAYHLYKSGEFEYNLTREDVFLNEIRNKQFQIQSIEFQLLQTYCKQPPGEFDDYFKQPIKIMEEINEKSHYQFQSKLSEVRLGKALTLLGYKRTKHTKTQRYGYYILFREEE